MKEVVAEAGIPTARHGEFTVEADALAFLDGMGDLFVVKTDGLADGKGVLVTTDRRRRTTRPGRTSPARPSVTQGAAS